MHTINYVIKSGSRITKKQKPQTILFISLQSLPRHLKYSMGFTHIIIHWILIDNNEE